MSNIDTTNSQYEALGREQSGFEDYPMKGVPYTCGHIEHAPPTHMVVPAGKRYKHICPGCGMASYVYSAIALC